MKRIFAASLIAAAASLPLVANAGAITGKIDVIQTGAGSTAEGVYGLVKILATPTGQPSCAVDQRFAFNPGTEEGKAIFALLVTARSLGKQVEIFGTGACNITGLPQNERISYMRLISS